jgi:glutamate synthase domain-containing protein 3
MLEQHADYAESSVAQKILDNWDKEREHFKFSIPLWLYKTQTAESDAVRQLQSAVHSVLESLQFASLYLARQSY